MSTSFLITLPLFAFLLEPLALFTLLLVESEFPLDAEHHLVLPFDHDILAQFEDQQPCLIHAVPFELQELYFALHIPFPLALHILRLT